MFTPPRSPSLLFAMPFLSDRLSTKAVFFCLPAEPIKVLQETMAPSMKNVTIPLEWRSIYLFNFLCFSIVCKAEKGDDDDNEDEDMMMMMVVVAMIFLLL